MNTIHNLRGLYIRELQQLLSVETHALEAFPLLLGACQDLSLKKSIAAHLEETRIHGTRLRTLLEALDVSLQGLPSRAMHGIIADAVQLIEETDASAVRDAGIVTILQRLKHFEIALYGSLRAFAITLGFSDAGNLLHQSLDDETAFDRRLTSIATHLNSLAQAPLPPTAITRP